MVDLFIETKTRNYSFPNITVEKAKNKGAKILARCPDAFVYYKTREVSCSKH